MCGASCFFTSLWAKLIGWGPCAREATDQMALLVAMNRDCQDFSLLLPPFQSLSDSLSLLSACSCCIAIKPGHDTQPFHGYTGCITKLWTKSESWTAVTLVTWPFAFWLAPISSIGCLHSLFLYPTSFCTSQPACAYSLVSCSG